MSFFEDAARRVKLQVERLRARYPLADIAVRTFKRYSDDDAGSYAAALTYYIFFATFPLLLFAAAIIGYVTFGNADLRRDLLQAAVDAVPLINDLLDEEMLTRIEARRQTLALTGIGLALYSGSGAVVALEHALNRLHGIANEPNFLQKRLRSLQWLSVLGGAAVLSVGLTSMSRFGDSIFGKDSPAAVVASILAVVGAFGVNVLIYTSAFKFLPAVTRRWRDVLPGAVAAAVGVEGLKIIGAVYLARGSAVRSEAFGALAGAATLLLGSYLIAQVTLLAAEVNAAIAERRESRRTAVDREVR